MDTFGFGRRNIWKWNFDHWEMRVHHSAEQTGFMHNDIVHVRIAFFLLSVWLIGQGGWKLHCRPGFDSWQFTVQAGKWHWAGNCKFCNCFIDCEQCHQPVTFPSQLVSTCIS